MIDAGDGNGSAAASSPPLPHSPGQRAPAALAAPTTPTNTGQRSAVQSFLSESRLSFIARWKERWRPMMAAMLHEPQLDPAMLREYGRLRRGGGSDEGGGDGVGGGSGGGSGSGAGGDSLMMHVDMDCFFVSVAIRERPELANKPVAVVSGSDATSEVCSANYVARSAGLRADMFVRDALRACPSLVTIPTSPQLFEQCAAVARLLYWSILSVEHPAY